MQSLFARLGGIRPIVGDRFVLMTPSEISGLERQIGGRFPDAYRHFLATYGASTFNGESPDNPYILFRTLTTLPPHITRDNKALFDAFYGGGKNEQDTYSLPERWRYFLGRMPESIVPIGDDGGAGQICLGIKGSEAGKIYYWDQQNEPLDEATYLEDYGEARPPEAIFQNVYLIANSFEDFLQRLECRAPSE